MIKLFAFVLLFSSCVSFVERTGRFLDGSASEEKKIAVYSNENIEVSIVQNKTGESSLLISINHFPVMKFRGSEPDDNGFFSLISLDYLSGSTHGWNEFTMEILGEGQFTSGEEAYLILTTEIDKVQISQGRIHRYETRITGNEALINLRNRHDRITALVEWMEYIEDIKTIEEFEAYWKPLLFPETVSARRRGESWLQTDDNFARAEGIRWNTSYTERVFPEELFSVRNSGTLLRDWEEALAWIYMYYKWNEITDILLQLQVLNEVN